MFVVLNALFLSFMIRMRFYYLLFAWFISKIVNCLANFVTNAIQLLQILLLKSNLANFIIEYTIILLGKDVIYSVIFSLYMYRLIVQSRVHWADFLPSGLIHKTRCVAWSMHISVSYGTLHSFKNYNANVLYHLLC